MSRVYPNDMTTSACRNLIPLIATFAIFALSTAGIAATITANVQSYGATGNGTTNDETAIKNAVQAIVNNGGNGTLYFPAGTYRCATAGDGVQFSGVSNITIQFDPTSELLMDNLDGSGNGTGCGVEFDGPCANISLQGVHVKWKTVPSSRSNGDAIRFMGYPSDAGSTISNVQMNNCTVEQAPQTGTIFMGCSDITVNGYVDHSTLADGLHFNACRRATVNGMNVSNNGDDGLAWVTYYNSSTSNFSIYNDGTGPWSQPGYTEWCDTNSVATNVSVSGGSANGVRFNQTNGVTVTNVSVSGKAGCGIIADAGIANGGSTGWSVLASQGVNLGNVFANNCATYGVGVYLDDSVGGSGNFLNFGIQQEAGSLISLTNNSVWGVLVQGFDSGNIISGVNFNNIYASSTVTGYCGNLCNSNTTNCSILYNGSQPEAPYGVPSPSYTGQGWAIPGTVCFDNYDTGGSGVGYSHLYTANSGVYRTDGNDITASGDTGYGNGYAVGWCNSGDWMNYAVNVAAAGTYTVALRLQSVTTNAQYLHIQDMYGSNLTGRISLPVTGGWQTVTTTLTLPAGQQILKVVNDTVNGGWNFDCMTFTAKGSGPYQGAPWGIPGTLNFANYDTGGSGLGYLHQNNANNGAYRTDGNDLATSGDAGYGVGYYVGWLDPGDWMNYTVFVAIPGTYTVNFRLASPTSNTQNFHIQDAFGNNLTGTVTVPNTGSYTTWATVPCSINLTKVGTQVLRVVNDTVNGGWNYDTLSFTAPAPPKNLTATGGTKKVTLTWSASTGATSYNIYRGTSPGGENSTVAAGITTTSYTNTGLTTGTTYYYTVRAGNTVGMLGFSTEANAKAK